MVTEKIEEQQIASGYSGQINMDAVLGDLSKELKKLDNKVRK